MPIVKATFDGRVFVPCEQVDIPAGTRVEVLISGPPRKLSPEEEKKWEEIRKQIAASPPPVGSFDDYLRYRRGEL
jgi:predicted DNA-binding antitoxin AbrB/MazE fold protein